MLIAATEEQIAAAHGNGGHGRWGHDFKLLVDPYGRETRFNKELERFTPEQKQAWLNAYTPKNEAMKASKLEGKDLALWKFNRYLKDYLELSNPLMMELVKYLITLMKLVWQKTRLLFTLQTKASTWENTVGLIKDSCMRNPLEPAFDAISKRN